MKQLLLVRHAKSDWESGALTDHDRPLNTKGYHQAQKMPQILLQQQITIDSLISSTAVRAYTTASYFAKAIGIKESNIQKEPSLYNAPLETYRLLIPKINDSANSVALFAHNPGITHIANLLSKNKIFEMPTCGVCIVQANCSNWEDFLEASKLYTQFLFL
jgi:phosphohistidine phosphatase